MKKRKYLLAMHRWRGTDREAVRIRNHYYDKLESVLKRVESYAKESRGTSSIMNYSLHIMRFNGQGYDHLHMMTFCQGEIQ